MAKFIRVHSEGDEMLINIDTVVFAVRSPGNTCGLMFNLHRGSKGIEDTIQLDESYDEVRRMIASATGGIPIGGKA